MRQRRDCQACIEEIIRESGVDKRPLEVYGRLAAKLVLERCAHAVETGFEAFVEEVRAEIGPMVAKPST